MSLPVPIVIAIPILDFSPIKILVLKLSDGRVNADNFICGEIACCRLTDNVGETFVKEPMPFL